GQCRELVAATTRAGWHRGGCRGRRRVLRLPGRRVLQRRDPPGRRWHARGASRERRRAPGGTVTATRGLTGRCALVTGGTSGIGRACVERLRVEGMTVTFTGRDRARGESIARETGAAFVACDHRDRAASDAAVQRTLELGGGRLDVLVANAGI